MDGDAAGVSSAPTGGAGGSTGPSDESTTRSAGDNPSVVRAREADASSVDAAVPPTVAPSSDRTSAGVAVRPASRFCGSVSMWTLGKFGFGFGNQLLQYAFLRCFAARYGLAPVIPSEWAALRVVGTEGACIVQEHWRPRLTDEGVDVAGAAAAPPPPGASAGGAAGAHVEGATDSPGTDAAEGASVEQAIDGCDGKLPSLYHRTVVCDRTMLSHPTWRRYASQLEPLRSAQAALPSGQQLSGRAVRRTVCQVTDAALVVPPGGVVFGDTGGEEGGRQLKNIDLTGWFQFSTTCYSPHRDAIRSYFAPATVHEMMKGVRDAVAALSAGSALVGVHVRRGDYADRGKLAASEWADTGPFFTAPLSLYAGCLGQLAEAAAPQSIAVFVASNDPAGVTRDPEMSGYTVLTSADVRAHMSDDAWNSAMESLGPELASFYVDWYCLSICDALLISNSTFSFTAAMVAARNDAAGVPGGMAAKGRFWRPTPVEEAPGGSAEVLPVALEMRSFDPWAAFPLLNASRGRKRKAAAIN